MRRDFDEFRRGWGVVLGSMVGIAFGMSAMGTTYTMGLFVQPLTASFGWSRGDVLAVVLFMTIALLPAGPVVGWASDRLGVFRFIAFSQVAVGACFVALGLFVQSLPMFYGLYIAMAILGSGTLPITFGKLVAMQFTAHRGVALGLALCGTGVCALVVPPYASHVLEHYGWRSAYVAIGVLPWIFALPASFIFLRRVGTGQPAASAMEMTGVRRVSPLPGLRMIQALRGYRFWLIAASFFLISGTATGILTNLVPLLRDRGFSPETAAATLSTFGLAVIVGRLGAGGLVDRFWAPAVGAVFLAAAALCTGALLLLCLGRYPVTAAHPPNGMVAAVLRHPR